ncbi:MAG: hypothetical protein D6732_11375 [Methanobacteriota archaeon]|nr:MAG: hypothetical protein D6732_11375 [Euryarchaeota archaeon]
MGKITKRVLVEWVDFECDRQLFLNLAEKDRNWIEPFRQLTLSKRYSQRSKLRYGNLFEHRIYQNILNLPNNVIANEKPNGEIEETVLTRNFLANASFEEPLILLEHSFIVPKQFWDNLFPKSKPKEYSDRLRPDIMVFRKIDRSEKIILPSGEVSEIPSDVENPIGICIWDIKITQEESINKKHFIEILHYISALQAFLKQEGLDQQFFILANENGIFPNKDRIQFFNFDQFQDHIVSFKYQDLKHLYSKIQSKIRTLSSQIPTSIETIPLRIQPACGRCRYLDDCKETLGYKKRPEDWSIDLLPYLEHATAEELKSMGINTIGQLYEQLPRIEPTSIPKPIYAELPLLRIKTEAILRTNRVPAPYGEAFTAAIPKFSDFSIIIDANLDPINDIVYNFGIYFSIFFSNNRPHSKCLNETWRILQEILECEDASPNSQTVQKGVDTLRQWSKTVNKHNLFRAATHLSNLLEDETIKTEIKSFENGTQKFELEYSYVLDNLEPSKELSLAQNAIQVFERIISLTSYLEEIIQVEMTYKGGTYISSPTTAAYYWSWEVISSIESLLERHLKSLLFQKKSREHLQKITSWLTPKESQVKNNLQFKKVYDLRLFAETLMGFPLVLNYTWHGIAKLYLEYFKIDRKYWREHFNYMEFNMWHLLIEETDINKKIHLLQKMHEQIRKKVRILDRLRVQFQQNQNRLISFQSKPVKNLALRKDFVPEEFHNLARVWLMFSKLTGAIQELEADFFKHIFPEFSIAKLRAAKISKIRKTVIEGPRGGVKYTYQFEMEGLSSNAKFSVGDMALVCPNELRDHPLMKFRTIRIVSMEWNDENNSFTITTDAVQFDLDKPIDDFVPSSETQWFLYPLGGDFWSKKLKFVLEQRHIGSSWLGQLIDWQLQLNLKSLKQPPSPEIDVAELYVFRPSELLKLKPTQPQTSLTRPLAPKPDSSQEKAILNSMNSVISLIQGPPGTGKSQTIANLVNEILSTTDKPVKILVTSFSYQAMHVVLEKLNKSKEMNGENALASKITKVFVRSASKEPAEGAEDFVKENKTWKLNGQSRVVTRERRLTDKLPDSFIVFANPQQLVNLSQPIDGKRVFDEDFAFDYIICDEASQMPLDQFLSVLLFLRSATAIIQVESEISEKGDLLNPDNLKVKIDADFNDLTKVILVGDHFQLPPVQPLSPPKKLAPILGSVFSYYVEVQNLTPVQLSVNYRSNQKIVSYTQSLEIYSDLTAAPLCKNYQIKGDIQQVKDPNLREILDPKKILCTIIHESQFDTALSPNEAFVTTALVEEYYQMISPQTPEEEIEFWSNQIGIVAPHNAQGRFIIRNIFNRINTISQLDAKRLMDQLRNTTFSVEKFQGSDRDLIIGTIGISSRLQLEKEEEFIYELNRFNVLTSRAKGKIILVASSNFLEYLPRKRVALENSARIRQFVNMCTNEKKLTVDINGNKIPITFKYS